MKNLLSRYHSIIILICIFSCSSNDSDNLEDSLLMNAVEGNFSLQTQQDVNDFGDLNYESVNGSIVIGNSNSVSNITSLEPLSNIKAIFGFLAIQNNPQLTSLNGLDNLQFMCFDEPSSIAIRNNESLIEISALGNLNSCELMGLTIENNNSLTNIDAFSNITTLSNMTLDGNDQLLDLSPFDRLENIVNLTLVDGNFSDVGFNNLNSCDQLLISSCNNLTHVNSLSNLNNLRVLAVGLPGAYLQYTYDPNMSNESLASMWDDYKEMYEGMDAVPYEEPTNKVKENFHNWLDEQTNDKTTIINIAQTGVKKGPIVMWRKWASVAAVLVCVFGFWTVYEHNQNAEIILADVSHQMETLMEQQSSTARIKAIRVNYNPNDLSVNRKMIQVLIDVLNKDKSRLRNGQTYTETSVYHRVAAASPPPTL